MSNNRDTDDMTHETTRGLTPRLRFPEFQGTGEWEEKLLHNISKRVVDRVGDASLTPVSITAGYGFVSQASKFGRDISGAQYKNYILLRRGDFAYNRGNSKRYPQGYVCQLKEFDQAAASTAFLCFRLKNGYEAGFIQGLFDTNIHGKQLSKHITSSARSDGLLNINPEVFFNIVLPIPSHKEQQRIAECLASLDELIAVHSEKLDALKAHKRGLLQQLFPAEGETVPRLRFPEFAEAGEWEEKKLGNIATIRSGTTPLRANAQYYEGGTIPWVKTTDLNNSFIQLTEERITPLTQARINPEGSILVAMYGGFNQIGRTGYLTIPAATNQAISVLNTNQEMVIPLYLLIWLNAKVDRWKNLASSSRKDPNITGADVANFPIIFPSITEQQRIAECLASLDEQVVAQSQKLDALRAHKKGLMQQLFPSADEVQG